MALRSRCRSLPEQRDIDSKVSQKHQKQSRLFGTEKSNLERFGVFEEITTSVRCWSKVIFILALCQSSNMHSRPHCDAFGKCAACTNSTTTHVVGSWVRTKAPIKCVNYPHDRIINSAPLPLSEHFGATLHRQMTSSTYLGWDATFCIWLACIR